MSRSGDEREEMERKETDDTARLMTAASLLTRVDVTSHTELCFLAFYTGDAAAAAATATSALLIRFTCQKKRRVINYNSSSTAVLANHG